MENGPSSLSPPLRIFRQRGIFQNGCGQARILTERIFGMLNRTKFNNRPAVTGNPNNLALFYDGLDQS